MFSPLSMILALLQGVPKQNVPKIVWLISLAANLLDGWDISHLKGGICSSVWSTETFLHDIREPRYKQSNMGCQISRILNDESIGYLEIWYHWDLFLIFLAIPILLGGDTSFLWYVPGSTSFVYNLREPKYKQNNLRHQNSRKKINQYLKFLIMKSNWNFSISWLFKGL